MEESGVDLGFDANILDAADCLGIGSDITLEVYDLKSKPIVGSPQTEIKFVNPCSRTDLKQQLQRLQAQQKNSSTRVPISQNSDPVAVPDLHVTEVPAQVLQVKSHLAHPTRYHIQEKQRHQVQSYVSDEMGRSHAFSAPTLNVVATGGSAPNSPNSFQERYNGLGNSFSEADEIVIDDVLSVCESVDSFDPDLTDIMSQTLPQNATSPFSLDCDAVKSSQSCPGDVRHTGGRQREKPPPFMTEAQAKVWAKERIKKDNHNVIERRRRYNINDRIKELGTMVPMGSDPDIRQNKGTILKTTVDYIRHLQRDQAKLRAVSEEKRRVENLNRQMLLRMQELELQLQRAGTQPTGPSSVDLLQDVLQTEVKEEPVLVEQYDPLLSSLSPIQDMNVDN